MKGDFKKLVNGAKDTGERVDDARERVTKMEAAGDTYFAGRAAAIKGIQNTDLREKGQQRLDESKKGYAGVLASLREAGQSLQKVRTDLDNQITFLGSDLTPSAMTSLKPEAQKFNERGAGALAKVDQAITTANKYSIRCGPPNPDQSLHDAGATDQPGRADVQSRARGRDASSGHWRALPFPGIRRQAGGRSAQGWQQRILVRRARCGTPCRTFPRQ